MALTKMDAKRAGFIRQCSVRSFAVDKLHNIRPITGTVILYTDLGNPALRIYRSDIYIYYWGPLLVQPTIITRSATSHELHVLVILLKHLHRSQLRKAAYKLQRMDATDQ
jgi:hypothetical protein